MSFPNFINDLKMKDLWGLGYDENIATAKQGAKVLTGELTEFLLDGDHSSYDMDKGYTRHAITGPEDQGIIVKLGFPSIINHIRMLLWDRDIR